MGGVEHGGKCGSFGDARACGDRHSDFFAVSFLAARGERGGDCGVDDGGAGGGGVLYVAEYEDDV